VRVQVKADPVAPRVALACKLRRGAPGPDRCIAEPFQRREEAPRAISGLGPERADDIGGMPRIHGRQEYDLAAMPLHPLDLGQSI